MSRRRVEPDQAEALRTQIETYSERVLVQSRRPWSSWVQWNPRLGGGPLLIVRKASVEIAASQGMRLESRCYIFRGKEATMSRDRIGLLGIPIGKRDCLRIKLDSGIQFAVSPLGNIDEAWKALAEAGVRTA